MADLYYTPVSYGIDDVVIPSGSGNVAARVYYPSESGWFWGAAIRSGRYPLVIFAHGDRSNAVPPLCPPDDTHDFRRWEAVLHLLARCGFVVAAPAVHGVVSDPLAAAIILEDTAEWMYTHWIWSDTLRYPEEFVDAAGQLARLQQVNYLNVKGGAGPEAAFGTFGPFHHPTFGLPLPLGLIGHSWGMRACCQVAVRGKVRVSSLSAIAGTFDDNESPANFTAANKPSLLIAGTGEPTDLSYLTGLWRQTPRPKHQAALLGLGHWDWFGPNGGIKPCSTNESRPGCRLDGILRQSCC